jgi:hypothetical protein
MDFASTEIEGFIRKLGLVVTVTFLDGKRRSDILDGQPVTGKAPVMNMKAILVGVIALSMASSAALAGGRKGSSALDDPDLMKTFYTDAEMKNLKTDVELKTVWNSTAQEDREAMIKECGDSVTGRPHNDLCSKTKQLGGAN